MSVKFNGGTHYFNYLCEMGFIKNNDTVRNNRIEGKIQKNIFGIPIGYIIFATMDETGLIKISYASENDVKKYENALDKYTEHDRIDEYYQNCDAWFEKSFSKQKNLIVKIKHEEK